MKELILHTVTVFMGFFAIMNPIANIPIFLSLTADEDKETVRSIALRSVFIAFVIVAIFAIAESDFRPLWHHPLCVAYYWGDLSLHDWF